MALRTPTTIRASPRAIRRHSASRLLPVSPEWSTAQRPPKRFLTVSAT